MVKLETKVLSLSLFFFSRSSISSLSDTNPHSSMFLLSNTAVGSWEIHSFDNLTS